MRIDPDRCSKCGDCIPYCPVGALRAGDIDQIECVECGVCLRSGICTTNAILKTELAWPRSIRAAFSDPKSTHAETGIRGRGTNEVKTNDVTGRYRHGEAGVLIEVGRPGIGTSFREVEAVTIALASFGVVFEPENPLTSLLLDKQSGKLDAQILDEKVLSAIIEFKIDIQHLSKILNHIKQFSTKLKTVFSLSIICRPEKNMNLPMLTIARESGFEPYPNAKVNLGFGRPLAKES
jgi:NAD-dependent dihydropyrimidine dehydrogenase PreA subunit